MKKGRACRGVPLTLRSLLVVALAGAVLLALPELLAHPAISHQEVGREQSLRRLRTPRVDLWDSPPQASSSSEGLTGESGAAVSSLTADDLQAALEDWVSQRPGSYGIVVVDLARGDRYSVNPHLSFPTASLYKLFVLAETYRQIELGTLRLTDPLTVPEVDEANGEPTNGVTAGEEITVGQAIKAIARVSSNRAAWGLLRLLGPTTVARFPARLGLSDTRLLFGREEVTSAHDIAVYFERLADGDIVSPLASQEILELLAESRIDDRLPAKLPPGTIVAHKTGNLDGVVHDAGLIYTENGAIVVALLSQEVGYEQAVADFSSLSRMIYDVLLGD